MDGAAASCLPYVRIMRKHSSTLLTGLLNYDNMLLEVLMTISITQSDRPLVLDTAGCRCLRLWSLVESEIVMCKSNHESQQAIPVRLVLLM